MGHGQSITHTDLVAYHTELVVMLWDVVRCRCLVKYSELPTSGYDIQGDFSRVATTSPVFTRTFLRVSATFHDLYRRDVV